MIAKETGFEPCRLSASCFAGADFCSGNDKTAANTSVLARDLKQHGHKSARKNRQGFDSRLLKEGIAKNMLDIRKYEAIAMLEFSDEERSQIAKRAAAAVEAFSALDGIGTDSVEPLVTVLNTKNILREDISKKLLTRDELLANAPEAQDGFFSVPEILT